MKRCGPEFDSRRVHLREGLILGLELDDIPKMLAAAAVGYAAKR